MPAPVEACRRGSVDVFVVVALRDATRIDKSVQVGRRNVGRHEALHRVAAVRVADVILGVAQHALQLGLALGRRVVTGPVTHMVLDQAFAGGDDGVFFLREGVDDVGVRGCNISRLGLKRSSTYWRPRRGRRFIFEW